MLDETIKTLGRLIAFPTVSADSNLEMIAYLAQRLEDVGARVEIMRDESGTKANLFATVGPDRAGGIVLSGHSDVVPVVDQPWSRDPFEMMEQDGRLFGRGACDMKGFIAAAIAMAPRFAKAATARPLHFAFTYDEETGCLGARHLAEDLRARDLQPKAAIIGEPTSMRVIEGHKGCCEYTTRFGGLEGHGSDPDAGVNAVEYAVRYVARLLEIGDALRARAPAQSPFDPPHTTINVGALNGGLVHNVIPAKAQVDWEMRPVQPSDAAFVKRSIGAFCEEVLLPRMRAVSAQATIETEIIGEVAGLLPSSENEARQIVSELTGANWADVVSFSTEAGLFQELGMDVVVCGPGSIDQAHKADEFLAIDQLAQCLRMMDGLATRLG